MNSGPGIYHHYSHMIPSVKTIYTISTLIGKRGVRQVLQLESEGSLLLQVADILLGSLNFLKRTAKVADQKKTAKSVIAEQVESLQFEKSDKKKDGYTVTVYRLYSSSLPL